MDIPTAIDAEASYMTLERNAGSRKVALIFHLKIEDFEGYENWLNESQNQFWGSSAEFVGKLGCR